MSAAPATPSPFGRGAQRVRFGLDADSRALRALVLWLWLPDDYPSPPALALNPEADQLAGELIGYHAQHGESDPAFLALARALATDLWAVAQVD